MEFSARAGGSAGTVYGGTGLTGPEVVQREEVGADGNDAKGHAERDERRENAAGAARVSRRAEREEAGDVPGSRGVRVGRAHCGLLTHCVGGFKRVRQDGVCLTRWHVSGAASLRRRVTGLCTTH